MNDHPADPKQVAKTVTIVVNGRPKEVPKHEDLSYEEIIALAFNPVPVGPDVQFSVQYTRGNGHKPSGTLVADQLVKPKDGMVFDVTQTNRS